MEVAPQDYKQGAVVGLLPVDEIVDESGRTVWVSGSFVRSQYRRQAPYLLGMPFRWQSSDRDYEPGPRDKPDQWHKYWALFTEGHRDVTRKPAPSKLPYVAPSLGGDSNVELRTYSEHESELTGYTYYPSEPSLVHITEQYTCRAQVCYRHRVLESGGWPFDPAFIVHAKRDIAAGETLTQNYLGRYVVPSRNGAGPGVVRVVE